MDPEKRGASRLRRLQVALAPQRSRRAFLEQPFSVRPLGTAGLGLRRAINDTVVAFVPPGQVLTGPGLICTDALVEFTSSGFWTLNVHVEATSRAGVAFVAGFVTNQRGYFAGMVGALNFAEGPPNTSTAAGTGTFSVRGFSQWLDESYDVAVTEGVTIRVLSSTDLQAQIRSFVEKWARSFDRPLYRPLSLLDTDYDDNAAWGVPEMQGGSLLDQVGQGEGLSFEVSLRFE
jgi:hypothetical protein